MGDCRVEAHMSSEYTFDGRKALGPKGIAIRLWSERRFKAQALISSPNLFESFRETPRCRPIACFLAVHSFPWGKSQH